MMMKKNILIEVLFAVLFVTLRTSTKFVSASDTTGSPSCELSCGDHGVCEEGSADFTEHEVYRNGDTTVMNTIVHSFHRKKTDVNGQFCSCQTGYTGFFCNHTFIKCTQDELQQEEQQHICYHGGVCHPTIDVLTNQQVNVCDCRTAIDERTNIRYVGQFCEHAATTKCNPTGTEFCVNGGICTQGQQAETTPCQCPTDYTGRHCQYSQQADDPGGLSALSCNLKCQNGGQCNIGLRAATKAETEFHTNSNFNPNHAVTFQHCSCKPGFFGLFCEHESTLCGDRHCFNGANCLHKDNGNGVTQYHCDCTSANNYTHSFAGRGCESHSTSFCTKSQNAQGHTFCTNNGECHDTGVGGMYDCTCSPEYTGPHCEFPSEQHPTATIEAITAGTLHEEECTLKCMNNGKCMPGVKDHGVLSKLASIDHLINVSTATFHHCQCPEGYAGVFCEHEVQICGEGEHACFHGSGCAAVGKDWTCNCDQATRLVAGPYCQHNATSVCDLQAAKAFCTNHGACQSTAQTRIGCMCPVGFHGSRCEFSSVEEANAAEVLRKRQQSDNNTNQGEVMVVLFSALFSTLGVIIVICVVGITNRYQKKSGSKDSDAIFTPATTTTVSPKSRSVPPAEAFPTSPTGEGGNTLAEGAEADVSSNYTTASSADVDADDKKDLKDVEMVEETQINEII